MSLTDSIVSAESGGDPGAKNPNSTASGPGQFLDSTWLATLKAHRPDIAQGQSDAALLALKNDPTLAADMTGAYAADNQTVLAKNGLPITPGTTYLAHFAGPGGAVKVLQADPDASVEDLLGPKVVAANPFLKGMTARGLQAWAAKKMGATVPAPSLPSPAVAPQPPVAPVSAIPPQPAPIFAPQPAAAPAPPPPAFAQIPAMQALPIFTPQRKPIDLSGLRAMLANRAPIFPGQG
jgi:hypothetical protein